MQAAADFIMNETTQNRLGLSLSRFFWTGDQRWDPSEAEFDDFGDYHIFVAWYGKTFGRPECIDWVNDQMKRWKVFKQPCGLYFSLWKAGTQTPKPSKWRRVSFYDHHDAVVGFNAMYHLAEDLYYLNEWIDISKQAMFYAEKYNGFIPNEVFPRFKSAVWYKTASPTVGSLIAEELVYLTETTGDSIYATAAEKILMAWATCPPFKKAHVWPLGISPYFRWWNPYKKTWLMKESTNMIYALNKYLRYKESSDLRQAVSDWRKGLIRFESKGGGYYDTFNFSSGGVENTRVDKTHNFAILEALVDIGDLEAAKKLADTWSGKTGVTGLIPEYLDPEGVPLVSYAKLDQSGDLGVAFLKLAEATGDKKYYDAASETARGMSYFLHENGWWHRLIDVNTGHPPKESELSENDRPGGRNLTKYVGGALKFLMTWELVKSGATFEKNKTLALLTRDR